MHIRNGQTGVFTINCHTRQIRNVLTARIGAALHRAALDVPLAHDAASVIVEGRRGGAVCGHVGGVIELRAAAAAASVAATGAAGCGLVGGGGGGGRWRRRWRRQRNLFMWLLLMLVVLVVVIAVMLVVWWVMMVVVELRMRGR